MALAALALVSVGANQHRAEAGALSPACAGDLRHLSWTWQFSIDGPPSTIAQNLVNHNMGVIVKSHDGTDWMSTFDHSPDAVSGPAQVRKLADYFESRGVPFLTYAVVHGEDPIGEANMAAQVLASGARAIVLDLEPWQGYWRGSPQSAQAFGQELRRLAPNAVVLTAVDPRPWALPNVPLAQFASFSDAWAPMVYWESFHTGANVQAYTDAGWPPGPGGITPEFVLDVGTAVLDRYNLPIVPIGQGASQDMGAWARFVDHSTQMGMPVVSAWRYGVTYPPVFDLLRDKSPGGWPAVCGSTLAGRFLSGDFNGDGRDDLLHLTRRDFVRPWISRTDASFNVGFLRPWPGYDLQSGTWLTGKFNYGDYRDDIIHLTDGDYANIWLAKRGGSFTVKSFRPWPGYGMQSGSWQTGDFNGDGRDDLVHLTAGDYVQTWLGQADGTFSVGSFRPWPGYAIQSGSWKTGDFNGDGKDDLVHLTAGDYVQTWLGQANGAFSLRFFCPWPGYAIQSGSWETGDFNGDGRDDLVHLPGGDYVQTWLGQANGAFSVGYFQPWPGYRL